MKFSEDDLRDMELVAWVGPDEYDGSRGIKTGRVPAGYIPLVAKGEHEHKLARDEIRGGLQQLADQYGNAIQLVRFRYAEIIDVIEPRSWDGLTDTEAAANEATWND